MTITLPPDQRQWLEAQVAAGHFPSVDEALQAAIGEMMALAAENFEWARPYIEEADASVARGEGIPGPQFFVGLTTRASEIRLRAASLAGTFAIGMPPARQKS